MCETLIILLSFNSLYASFKSPDEATYEKYYHKYVDSPEPLSVIQAREGQFYHSYYDYIRNNYLKPSYTIKYGPHELQALDIYLHQGLKPAPVIFFIHSGYDDKIQVQQAVRQWISLGYTVVSINHRQISSDQHPQAGPKTTFADQREDCFLALKWVMDNIQKYGADGNRIAIVGISVGGYMTALMVTGTKWHKKYGIDIHKIKCWIPMSGFYSLSLRENYLSPTIAGYLDLIKIQSNNDASPIEYITGKEPPSLIICGCDDWAVPRTNATALYNKLKEKDATTILAMFRGYMHANIFMGYYNKDHLPAKLIKRFLAKYMPTDLYH
ncbi:MAG: alpha/beta hydrolase [Smithella sp.]|jgi:acetyl esterase/lipase